MRGTTLSFTIALAAMVAGPLHAEDSCPPLTLISRVDMQIGNDGRPYIPVKINTVAKSMLVDTGGFFTELTKQAVDELKLKTRTTDMTLIGVKGETSQLATHASMTMGNRTSDGMDFMVLHGKEAFTRDMTNAVGTLAPNILTGYDVDFDFGARKFSLLSQKHCTGKVVYWPATSVAVVPMQVSDNLHIRVPVTLDGVRLMAILDTGASNSVLNLQTALAKFPLKLGDRDTPAYDKGNDSALSKRYFHRFKTLQLEGLTIGNPTMQLVPDMMSLHMSADTISGGSRLPDPNVETHLSDVILGMNVLRQLHLYIAYKEHNLYITPATAPAVAATEQNGGDAAKSAESAGH